MADEVATASEQKQEQAVQPLEQTTIETPLKTEETPATEKTTEEKTAVAKAKPKKKIIKSTFSSAKKEEAKTDAEEKSAAKSNDKRAKKETEKVNTEEIRRKKFAHLKLFNRWPMDVVVNDLGLRNYINLAPVVVPWSAGRNIKKQFWKSKKSIIERLMLKMMAAGHKGKKHFRTSNINTGKFTTIYNDLKKAFEIIEQRTKKNPVEVLVRALETGSPR